MVSAATKRKKRDRQNQVAKAVEEGRRLAAIEQKVLGTQVAPSVPDALLFQIDRKGLNKQQAQERREKIDRLARLEAKRAARANPPPRKSELGADAPDNMQVDVENPLPVHGRKKKRVAGLVEDQILRKHFAAPSDTHHSKLTQPKNPHPEKCEGDVWTSDLAETVKSQISDQRRRLVRKVTRRMRRAPAVIYPDAGVSVNPSYEHHQDKLGEAVAAIISKEDRDRWDEQKLSFDPAILNESRAEEFGDTGMKTDMQLDNASNEKDVFSAVDNGDDTAPVVKNIAPERKTRQEKNKEARKREMESNIRKKRREARQEADISNLSSILEEAKDEADKINGVTKKRIQAQRIRVPLRPNKPIKKRIGGRRVRCEANAELVSLSEDLSKNFRSVQLPLTNPMLHERMLSFERRGMVEPPKVLATEMWRMEQERRQKERKDTRKRKGKHSTSDISYWKEKSLKK